MRDNLFLAASLGGLRTRERKRLEAKNGPCVCDFGLKDKSELRRTRENGEGGSAFVKCSLTRAGIDANEIQR